MFKNSFLSLQNSFVRNKLYLLLLLLTLNCNGCLFLVLLTFLTTREYGMGVFSIIKRYLLCLVSLLCLFQWCHRVFQGVTTFDQICTLIYILKKTNLKIGIKTTQKKIFLKMFLRCKVKSIIILMLVCD